jgi:hypothetical protein
LRQDLFRLRSGDTDNQGPKWTGQRARKRRIRRRNILASLTQELAEIARRNGLDTLSHILEMARLEADQLIKR